MRIRQATVADAAAIGKVQLASWRTMFHDSGIDAAAYLAEFSDEERAEDWNELLNAPGNQLIFVAESDDAEIVGFALGIPESSPDGKYASELSIVHLLPAYRNQGIGRQLFAAVARNLKDEGRGSLFLWVLSGNTGARRFYERLGGQLFGANKHMVGK